MLKIGCLKCRSAEIEPRPHRPNTDHRIATPPHRHTAMANVGRSGYAIAKPTVRRINAPPKYVKPMHAFPRAAPPVVYGNSYAWDAFHRWLAAHPTGGVFVLRGPSGTGKTHTTRLIASSLNYAVNEVNASFGESVAAFSSLLHEASRVVRLPGGRRVLILVDEFDCMPPELQNAVLSHVRSMNGSDAPLVCTCNDFASATVRFVAGLAKESYQLRPIADVDLLKYAARYYGSRPSTVIRAAVGSARGDIRQLDIRLRVADAAKPDSLCNPFELGRAIITRRAPARWLTAISTNTDSRLVLYLAHENYTSAAPSLDALADAADLYSKAECMQSFHVIGALDEFVAILGASGPSLTACPWNMRHDTTIVWPHLLRARSTTATTSIGKSTPLRYVK